MYTGRDDSYLERTLENDGFYPDVVLGDFQRHYRLPNTYSEEMIVNELKLSIALVNKKIGSQREEWEQTASTLAEVSDSLNLFYLRAVSCRAAIDLLERNFTALNRDHAEHIGREDLESTNQLMSDYNTAIAYLLGESPHSGKAVLL